MLLGMSAAPLSPVDLVGRHTHLVPLAREHVDALWEAGRHPSLWSWMPSPVDSREDMQAYVEEALAAAASGAALPFATTLATSGEVVGSTRFAAYAPEHAKVEIGWTWITPDHQRSAVNTEAKLLMLRHAFETLELRRVELKTDALNTASRAAILRLGAVEEGTLRAHLITAGGRSRDSVYFSILRAEWPEVRARLEARLARG